MSSHGLRLVAPREQLLAQTRPVRRQIRRQLLHRHPVDAGAALVLLHSLRSAASTLLRSTTSSISFSSSFPERSSSCAADRASPLRSPLGASPLPASGELQLPRTSGAVSLSRLTVVSLSSPFGPSPLEVAARPLLRPRLTSRSASCARRPFRREARSPQVRTLSFAARSPDLRRLSLDHRGFAVICPLAPLDVASYPVLCSSTRGFAPRFLPTVGRPSAVARSLRSGWSPFGGTCTRKTAPMLGAQMTKAPAALGCEGLRVMADLGRPLAKGHFASLSARSISFLNFANGCAPLT